MSISLTPEGGTAIALPPDLLWMNEMQWSSVGQSKERSITGALIVDVVPKVAGRPVELKGVQNSAWISRDELKALRAAAAVPGGRCVLSWNGESHAVIFDHGDSDASAAVTAEPVVDFCDPQDADYYHSLVVRLITV